MTENLLKTVLSTNQSNNHCSDPRGLLLMSYLTLSQTYMLYDIYAPTTFENIVSNGEIAHNDKVLIFHIVSFLFNIFIFIHRDFSRFFSIISKSSAAVLLYVGKGLTIITSSVHLSTF